LKAENDVILFQKAIMIKNKDNNLAEFVKNRRKSIQLTQIELAEKAGVGLRFIRDLEQGKLSMRTDKINDVLRLFGYTLGAVAMDRAKIMNDEQNG
jgi:y4mF family transcriptional regulator